MMWHINIQKCDINEWRGDDLFDNVKQELNGLGQSTYQLELPFLWDCSFGKSREDRGFSDNRTLARFIRATEKLPKWVEIIFCGVLKSNIAEKPPKLVVSTRSALKFNVGYALVPIGIQHDDSVIINQASNGSSCQSSRLIDTSLKILDLVKHSVVAVVIDYDVNENKYQGLIIINNNGNKEAISCDLAIAVAYALRRNLRIYINKNAIFEGNVFLQHRK
jgi:bifunctional DNase/RNase